MCRGIFVSENSSGRVNDTPGDTGGHHRSLEHFESASRRTVDVVFTSALQRFWSISLGQQRVQNKIKKL